MKEAVSEHEMVIVELSSLVQASTPSPHRKSGSRRQRKSPRQPSSRTPRGNNTSNNNNSNNNNNDNNNVDEKGHSSQGLPLLRHYQESTKNNNEMFLPDFLVSVTQPSNKSRQGQNRNNFCHGCCCRSCCFKILVLIVIYMIYREMTEAYFLQQGRDYFHAPSIKRDYSSIRDVNDLSTEGVAKCFEYVKGCPCEDPLIPSGREKEHGWEKRHDANVEMVMEDKSRNVDVVFYGDSITEAWLGTSYGTHVARGEGCREVFDSFFKKSKGAKYDGIAMGISGDSSPNLLWRLRNQELPNRLDPAVIWLLIGTNDIGRTWCSPEMTLIGIIRVVEEIRKRKPYAKIVINGLLPRSFNDKGYVAKGHKIKPSVWEDIKAINDELKLYASYRKDIYYYETNIFFVDPTVPDNKLQINRDLMPDFLHPNAKGYKKWANEITAKLDQLIFV